MDSVKVAAKSSLPPSLRLPPIRLRKVAHDCARKLADFPANPSLNPKIQGN
jgi:hypothetical protein